MRIRIFISLMLGAALTASAQRQRWTDNWFVGVHGGVNAKWTDTEFLTNLNPHASLRVGRDLVPWLGLMVEGTAFLDDQRFGMSHTMVKAVNADLLAYVNLGNALWGYPGYQRIFEARLLAGGGVNHIFGLQTQRNNDFVTKLGLDLAFRLDPRGHWEAFLQPALNFNMNHYSQPATFNLNYAAWQVAAGVSYRFSRVFGTKNERRTSLRRQHTAEPSLLPALDFSQGEDQLLLTLDATLSAVATFMRTHPGTTIHIVGQEERIEMVRQLLVRHYEVDEVMLLPVPTRNTERVSFRVGQNSEFIEFIE